MPNPSLNPSLKSNPNLSSRFFFVLGGFFFPNALEVLSMPKAFWQRMTNLSSSSSLKLYLNLSLIFFLVFEVFFSQKCFGPSLGAKSNSTMHDEPKLKLGFKIKLKLELKFYFYKCLRVTLGANNSLVVHDETNMKFRFKIGPRFEPMFFFFCKCF